MLHRFSIRHPFAVIAIALLVTLAMAPGIARLRLRTDGHALVPENAAAVRLDRAVRDQFGLRDPIVVLVRPDDADGIFNPRTPRLIAELTRAFARLPGLDSASVRSLATEPSDHFRPGTLQRRRMLEPLPETPQRLDELRGDLAAIRLYTGTFVSFDGKAAAIHVRTPPEADRSALVASLERANAAADLAGHRVDVIGAPVAEALLGAHILEDLGVSRRPAAAAGRLADRSEAGAGPGSRLRGAIARHIGLLPLSILLMAAVFLLAFRSVGATLLPLGEAAACLVFVFGLMGWTGVPVYLTMAVLPVILVSMGLADEIHVFTAHRRHRAAQPGAPAAAVVRAALDEMSLPVVATSVTTAVGFLSFAISPLEPVRAFGLFTAAGILFCMLWTLTVIPALLVLMPSHPPAGAAAAPPGPGAWSRIAARIARHPAPFFALAAIAIAVTPLGIRRLEVQDSWIGGFARASAFRRATEYFNDHFYGTHQLFLALDAGHLERSGLLPAADLSIFELRFPADLLPDPEAMVGCSLVVARKEVRVADHRPAFWSSIVERAERRDGGIVVTTPLVHGSALFLLAPAPGETLQYRLRSQRLAVPAVLRRVEELERFVARHRGSAVGGVLGPADHIATAEFLTNERDPESRVIPSNPEQVRWLWNAIGLVQGEERLREIVDPDLRRGLVTVFLKDANYVGTARLFEALRAFERDSLSPAGIRLDLAGDVAVSQALIEAIVTSQVRSVLLSLLGILAVTTVLFRSLRWGLMCTLPASMAVAVTFAAMGWSRMPLGVATSMFAGMVLGIGVDFAIHLVQRFRRAVAEGAGREAAIADALAATGPAIGINALAVAMGFGILTLSQVPANARLGALTAVGLLACLAATLLVLPALLRWAGGAPAEERSGGRIATPAS